MNDPIELEQFIQKHYTTICTIALKFVGSSDIAQDIAQDVIVKFWENRKQYKTLDSVENFLFIMTRNESLNYIRSVKRENERYKQLWYSGKNHRGRSQPNINPRYPTIATPKRTYHPSNPRWQQREGNC